MKYQIFFTAVCFTFFSRQGLTQDVNYATIGDSSQHLVSLNFGADYNAYYGLSYGYILHTKYIPLVLGTEINNAFGSDIFDDWKWKINVQGQVMQKNKFSVNIKPGLILRRYESPLALMYSIATDITISAGYSKPKWGVVAILNYDRTIATHIEHFLLQEYYLEIQNGWYNSSGGNFKFGARANWSIRSFNTFLTLGKTYGQNFTDNPTLPFFTELSVQKQF